MSAAPTPSASSPLAPAESSARRAYLRSSIAVQTPRIEEPSAGSTPRGRTAAMSYFDPQREDGLRSAQPAASSRPSTSSHRDPNTSPTDSTHAHHGHTTSPSRSGSRVRGPTGDTMRSSEELQAQLAAYSLSPSRRSSVSVARTSSVAPRTQQPAFVPKKDSLALKPLPVSALLHSPPHSPPRSSHSSRESSGSLGVSQFAHMSRSRAGSIASVAPRAPSREGSLYEGRSGRTGSSRAYLPPVEALPPMEFARFGDGEDDDLS